MIGSNRPLAKVFGSRFDVFQKSRKAGLVRNHIGCAVLVWIRPKQVAYETHRSIYQVKNGLLSDYLRQQLKSISIQKVLT